MKVKSNVKAGQTVSVSVESHNEVTVSQTTSVNVSIGPEPAPPA